MRFGTWNVKRLYRAGSLTAAVRKVARYKLNWWVCRGLGGTEGDCKSRGLYFFSMEKESKIINREQEIVYTTELCQRLRE